jgi:hypothetical protein
MAPQLALLFIHALLATSDSFEDRRFETEPTRVEVVVPYDEVSMDIEPLPTPGTKVRLLGVEFRGGVRTPFVIDMVRVKAVDAVSKATTIIVTLDEARALKQATRNPHLHLLLMKPR